MCSVVFNSIASVPITSTKFKYKEKAEVILIWAVRQGGKGQLLVANKELNMTKNGKSPKELTLRAKRNKLHKVVEMCNWQPRTCI